MTMTTANPGLVQIIDGNIFADLDQRATKHSLEPHEQQQLVREITHYAMKVWNEEHRKTKMSEVGTIFSQYLEKRAEDHYKLND